MSQLDISNEATSTPNHFAYCSQCGSDQIARDAWALFDTKTQEWELGAVFDHTFCLACETEARIEWSESPLPRPERIARLNDILRAGGDSNGQWLITKGVQALGNEVVRDAVALVRGFKDFSEENDPHSERDFGSFDLQEEKFFFKIDYYDLSLRAGSEDPADPDKTCRVLTLMLASEY